MSIKTFSEVEEEYRNRYPNTFKKLCDEGTYFNKYSAWFECKRCGNGIHRGRNPVSDDKICKQCQKSSLNGSKLLNGKRIVDNPLFIKFVKSTGRDRRVLFRCPCGCGATAEIHECSVPKERIQGCMGCYSSFVGIVREKRRKSFRGQVYIDGKAMFVCSDTDDFRAAIKRDQILRDVGPEIQGKNKFSLSEDQRAAYIPDHPLYLEDIKPYPRNIYPRDNGFIVDIRYNGARVQRMASTLDKAKKIKKEIRNAIAIMKEAEQLKKGSKCS